MISGEIAKVFPGLLNHLWQSTVFAFAVAMLTLAFRGNRAAARYWMWLSASLKFLLPFGLLIAFGGAAWHTLGAQSAATGIVGPAISQAIVAAAQPAAETVSSAAPSQSATGWLPVVPVGPVVPVVLGAVWACGFLAVVLVRGRAWLRVRAAIRVGNRMHIDAPVEVLSTIPPLIEPGVVGIFSPILLLPDGILESLTPPQLESVLAHELAHVRRRDNLTASLHMLVEAIFWFHPMVWWIGTRLLVERERACDEAVVSLGNRPHVYAEAILSVCKLYSESPLKCVSGVTGNSVRTRVRTILTQRLPGDMNMMKKAALALFGTIALATPVLVGVIATHTTHAQPQTSSVLSVLSATPMPPEATNHGRGNASPSASFPYLSALGNVTAVSATVRAQAEGQLVSLNFGEGGAVKEGQVLASIDVPERRLELENAQRSLEMDEERLGESTNPSPDVRNEVQAAIQNDQRQVQEAQRTASLDQVVAPIAGIAGLRLIDPGNIVHPGDALVVVNQIEPISATFEVPEDYISAVLSALRSGSNPKVELWSRTDATKLATGRLVATDNQIDTNTGTVKLRASFENKDGLLFPNEFVNVRLFLNSR